MDRNKIKQQREKLLKKACDELTEEMIPALFKDKEESGIEDGELAILFDELGSNNDEAFGEFFFNPIMSDEDAVQYYTCLIILTEEVDKDKLPLLYEALTFINYYLPFGCFAIDGDNESIVYKYVQALPINMKDDALYEQIQIAMGNAITIADSNINLVLSIEDGTMDMDDVKQIFDSSSLEGE